MGRVLSKEESDEIDAKGLWFSVADYHGTVYVNRQTKEQAEQFVKNDKGEWKLFIHDMRR